MMLAKSLKNGAQGLTRTADTRIFSPPSHKPKSPKKPYFLRHTASEIAESRGTNGGFLPHRIRTVQLPAFVGASLASCGWTAIPHRLNL